VQAVFARRDLTNVERLKVFDRVVKYYKEEPSAERARLLQDLTNVQAAAVAGISSRTMAKARKPVVSAHDAAQRAPRNRIGNGGFSTVEVCDVAQEACMDPRFCDMRSWVAYAGDSEQRHWEAVGIVDVETMWCALGVDLGDPNWTSLSTFRRCLPGAWWY